MQKNHFTLKNTKMKMFNSWIDSFFFQNHLKTLSKMTIGWNFSFVPFNFKNMILYPWLSQPSVDCQDTEHDILSSSTNPSEWLVLKCHLSAHSHSHSWPWPRTGRFYPAVNHKSTSSSVWCGFEPWSNFADHI